MSNQSKIDDCFIIQMRAETNNVNKLSFIVLRYCHIVLSSVHKRFIIVKEAFILQQALSYFLLLFI